MVATSSSQKLACQHGNSLVSPSCLSVLKIVQSASVARDSGFADYIEWRGQSVCDKVCHSVLRVRYWLRADGQVQLAACAGTGLGKPGLGCVCHRCGPQTA